MEAWRERIESARQGGAFIRGSKLHSSPALPPPPKKKNRKEKKENKGGVLVGTNYVHSGPSYSRVLFSC